MFKPMDGALWKLYQDTMQKFLVRQGNEYVAKPGNPSATPAFVAFFNRATVVSAAFFPANAQQPQLSFSVKVNPSEDVQAVTLSMGPQTLHYTGGTGAPQAFTWPGSGPLEVKLRVKFAGGSEFDFPGSMGQWAAFHFFSHFEHWQSSGGTSTMDWTLRAGTDPVVVPKSGRPATVGLVLDTGGAADVLKPGYFSGLTCAVPALR
jgi:type VI protein secretion system component VasK